SGGPRLCRIVRPGDLRPGQAARDHTDDPVAKGEPVTKVKASLVVGFLEALAAERGASVHTIEAYRRDLTDYVSHLSARGGDPLTNGAADVRAYLAACGAEGLKASSLARR